MKSFLQQTLLIQSKNFCPGSKLIEGYHLNFSIRDFLASVNHLGLFFQNLNSKGWGRIKKSALCWRLSIDPILRNPGVITLVDFEQVLGQDLFTTGGKLTGGISQPLWS